MKDRVPMFMFGTFVYLWLHQVRYMKPIHPDYNGTDGY